MDQVRALSSDEVFIARLTKVVLANLHNEQFGVEDLAREVGYSRFTIYRRLLRIKGQTITNFIGEIRLHKALELLTKTDDTASEIAYKVGFNDPSYFNKAFKKRYQATPGEIRKNASAGREMAVDSEQNNREGLNGKTGRHWWLYAIIVLALSSAVVFWHVPGSRERVASDKSIAILPFDNLSPDEENQYFADGMVEDLLNRLSTIGDLRVISRTSSEMFRDKGSKSAADVAGILGVQYILEGSIQREPEKVKISIQLIDAAEDNQLLSKQYIRDVHDIFNMQADIAEQVAYELSPLLTEKQKIHLRKNPTDNLNAFNYYQMGKHAFCACTKEEAQASIDYYNKAIHADSNYSLAYAGMAASYTHMAATFPTENKKELRDLAVKMAEKALEIDPELGEAHMALGTIYQELDFDMKAAERAFLRAIEENPNSSQILKEYAELLNTTGRTEKARYYIDKAIVNDPLTFNIRRISTMLYMCAGNYEEALKENQRSLELEKGHPWSLELNFFIHLGLKDERAAYESFRTMGSKTGEYRLQDIDSAYRASGVEGLLNLMIRTTKGWNVKAHCYAWLGDHESTIETLEIALEQNKLSPSFVHRIGTIDQEIRSDPRFIAIRNRVGLSKY